MDKFNGSDTKTLVTYIGNVCYIKWEIDKIDYKKLKALDSYNNQKGN